MYLLWCPMCRPRALARAGAPRQVQCGGPGERTTRLGRRTIAEERVDRVSALNPQKPSSAETCGQKACDRYQGGGQPSNASRTFDGTLGADVNDMTLCKLQQPSRD